MRSALLAVGIVTFAASSVSAAPSLRDPVRDAIGRAPADRGIAAYAVVPRLGYRDLGRMSAAAPVKLGILLRYQHEAELAQLTFAQTQPGSRYYHHFLSNAQWNAYFAPPEATVRRVAFEMQRHGFRVTRILPNRTLIDATGPAAAAERVFRTEIHRVLQTRGHGLTYANVRPAIMPDFLRGVAVSVAGLHSTDVAWYPREARHAARTAVPAAQPQPAVTSTPKPVVTSTPVPNPSPDPTLPGGVTNVRGTSGGGYGPFAYAVTYDEPEQHGYNGTGQNVGNVISGDFQDSDLTSQENEFGFKHTGTTTRIAVDTYYVPNTMTGTGDVGESSLDVQAILGMAPGANYYEYLVNTLADLATEDGYNRVVSDNIVGVVNSSFGGCEQDDPSWEFASNYIASQGAAKGISFNASTGDTGGNGCGPVTNGAPGQYQGVEAPSADYYFTAVGGTDLIVNPATGARIVETGWTTGGGGVSVINALPSWQMAGVQTGLTPNLTGRNVPDIAFCAALETGYEVWTGGSAGIVGGTSLASPLWAGTQTTINEINKSRAGWVTPRLYQIFAAQAYRFAFTDVTVGSNARFIAGPNYDDVTGIGTVNGWELAGTE